MINKIMYERDVIIPRLSRIRPEPLNALGIERFEEFVAGFRPIFHRADQFLRFRAYLRGILESPPRKNLEAIASAASAVMMVEANLAQALQHFVSNSPWDYRRLLARLRQESRPLRHDPAGHWVIHDAVFVKKGRHSVGVHRQFARSLGRKVNCQIGVVLAQVSPQGYFPLSARLYLPNAWLRDHDEAAHRHIPEADRIFLSRPQIALQLLADLLQEGETPRPIQAEAGYHSQELLDWLHHHELTLADSAGDELLEAVQIGDWLREDFGLDHFEGRNWQGWHHHVALVFTAYQFAGMSRAAECEPS